MNTTTPSPAPLSDKDLRVRLGFVEIPEMDGDNIAVLLCSHFENPEQDQDDEHGWTPDAIAGCNKTLDAIHVLYLATLTARDEIIAGLTADRDEARGIVADCNNSLFGSQGYFVEASGITAAEAIEKLKSNSGEYFRRAETAESRITVLEEALRPFAERVTVVTSPLSDDASVFVNMGDLRRAAASLSPPTQVAP